MIGSVGLLVLVAAACRPPPEESGAAPLETEPNPSETDPEPHTEPETETESESDPHTEPETGTETDSDTDTETVSDWVWSLPPTVLPPIVPDDNPMTVAKVELGRHLFYDVRLSGNGTQACATCHRQATGFAVPEATSVGSTGEPGVRNASHLANAAWNATYTWANPALLTLEDQIVVPLFGDLPIEMGVTGHEDEILGRLTRDATYTPLIEAAFPGTELGFHEIVSALACFVRSLVSFDSPYDRFLAGDVEALTEGERNGMDLYFSEVAQCHHCHNTFLFSDSMIHEATTFVERPFHNTGLYNIGGTGDYPPDNQGLYSITRIAEDMGAFRPVSLRNLTATGPYMHDGSVLSLEEILAIYERGGRLIEVGDYAGDGRENPFKSGFVPGFSLNEADRSDLLAFLAALTDPTFLVDPAHADPWKD